MSLTRAEAGARAAQVSDVSYSIELDLTDPSSGTFACRTTVRFAATVAETFLELSRADDLGVRINGTNGSWTYDGRRIALAGLDTAGRNEVVVQARLPYVTDGAGMHLFTDPADGETYASAYVGMDVAQRVFACFDQNDLKAPVTLTVLADPRWTVLANGTAERAGPGRWAFAPTRPIPPAMFVVCAGPWHSISWEYAGLPFGWHARRSLAADLDRDAADLRATTEACFDHYGRTFEEPFPFDSYDQVFVPGHNWGALETPGCVTFRDELLPRGSTPDLLRVQRASVVAHEMAHMWFGNLVTMAWWEDTWLQESFADYMGYRVAAEALGDPRAQLAFEIGRRPAAYDADLRRSTHPVAPLPEQVPDVAAAATNFDAISYAKGNAALRQLVTWLGDKQFFAGVNSYLSRHRFGNATLDDLIGALDDVSARDVASWARLWLRQPGFDTVRTSRDGDVPVLTREGVRPHRLRVTAYDARLTQVGSRLVDLGDEPVRLDDLAGHLVVPNSHGDTFARVVLDERSWQVVAAELGRIGDPMVRAQLWATAFGMVRDRELDAEDFLALLARHLPAERDLNIISAVLRRTFESVVPLRVAPDGAAGVFDHVAESCRRALTDADDNQVRLELTRGLAATSRDQAVLRQWLLDGRTGAGVHLDQPLRWSVVHRLAALGHLDRTGIEAERRDDGTIDGDLGAATALAARPTAEAKAEAWARITGDDELSNRMLGALFTGLWSPEQPGLVAPYVAAYFDQAPRLARRSDAVAQTLQYAFPALALSAEQVGLLEDALTGDLPTTLRRGWQDRLDDLR